MNWLAALWLRIRFALFIAKRYVRKWWVQPAPPPSKIGKAKEGEYRPIPIQIAFYLHATGRVYHRQRNGDGDRLVNDPSIIGLVHAEYKSLVKLAKKEQGWAAQFVRKIRLMRKAAQK